MNRELINEPRVIPSFLFSKKSKYRVAKSATDLVKEVKKEIENAGPAEAMEEPAKEEPVLLDIRKSKELNEQRTSTTVHAQGGLQ